MERVTFLIEHSGQRISCLLNPESVVLRRTAGVRRRSSASGLLTQDPYRENPLLYTGGGSTEMDLELLFDVTLDGVASALPEMPTPERERPPVRDVRELTSPVWSLSENVAIDRGNKRSPLVRFVWGKSWNVPAVVQAVAERFEYFTAEGLPRRSWLRVRLLRVDEPDERAADQPSVLEDPNVPSEFPEVPEEDLWIHEIVGGTAPEGGDQVARPDLIADATVGDVDKWPHLLAFNGVDDLDVLQDGFELRVPPTSVLEGGK